MAAVKELRRNVSYLFTTNEGEIVFTNINDFQFLLQAKNNKQQEDESKLTYRITSDMVLLYDAVDKLYTSAKLSRTFEGYEGTSGFAFQDGSYVVNTDVIKDNVNLSIIKDGEEYIIEFSGIGKNFKEGVVVYLDGMAHSRDNSISPYISFANYIKDNYENSLNISIDEYVRTRSGSHNK
ncbi:MAG: hypothetical protein K6G37_03080 [Bacilli bacterium]|nr:hypothetical protein [Bacilli bacterium]